MTQFLQTPHIPSGHVRLAAIGERYAPLLAEPLRSRGVETLWLPDDPDIDSRVAGHADMMLCHLREGRFVCAPHIVNILANRGMRPRTASRPRSAVYPNDAGLNVCIVGQYLFHNTSTTDGAVTELAGGCTAVNTRQGYARCAVSIVSAEAAMTADAGMLAALTRCGIDTLYIKEGGVELPGYATGFIGGASFLLSGRELAFTGSLDRHPDADAIRDFLRRHGVTPVCLTDGPLLDIGSAVLITEAPY